ncbi:MAG: glycerol-3-phosphate acyltransferase [Chloroflexi bacterium]|nr:glycerol-3-phosphate acyltransferase [Chloroflexota bacterium]
MQILSFVGILVAAYLIGSVPMGLLVVKITTGQDIREVQSGRTGGTNAMRAAGFWAGFATAFLDIFKGASGVWLARALVPGNHWLEVLSPIAAIIGHNYSIFLIERYENGKIRLRGGAGGAPFIGGAMGLWPWSIVWLVPIGAVILFGIGYASLTTLSAPLIATLIFAYRAWIGASPWEYVLYGLLSEILIIWALRPNIKRLLDGTERLVGWRARRAKSRSE